MSFPPLSGNLHLYAVVVVVFLLMLCVLVFAHEAGHYLFARLFNMGVEEFAVGFGRKPIWTYGRRKYVIPLKPGDDPDGRQLSAGIGTGILDERIGNMPDFGPGHQMKRVAQLMGSMEGGEKAHAVHSGTPASVGPEDPGPFTAPDVYPRHPSNVVVVAGERELHEETVFTIRPFPLGGFVRIKGMLPEEDGSETKIPGGFYSKAPWKRLIVLFAGPAFSVLAGILILVPVYMMVGITRPDERPVMGEPASKGPAEVAGLRDGDLILSIQGTPVATFSEVVKRITGSGGTPLKVEFERSGKDFTTTVTPLLDKEATPIVDSNLDSTNDMARQWHIGARPSLITSYPGVGAAFAGAVQAPIDTVVGIARIFQKPARFRNSVSGPGQMVGITAIAVQEGVLRVFQVMAYLSISVGIFNLLPFPPLDGGQMVIAFAEMLRGGRRLSMQIQGLVSAMGLLAVCSLIISALYVDFQQITKSPPKPPVSQTAPVTPVPASQGSVAQPKPTVPKPAISR